MHQYIFISIIYWKNKQQLLNGNKQTAVSNQFQHENHSAEQKLHDKKGLRVKKLHCKKIAAKM